MRNNCTICNSLSDLRLGVCWECATAESIIHEGVDMHDKGPTGTSEPARTAMDKLKFLIQKGIIKPYFITLSLFMLVACGSKEKKETLTACSKPMGNSCLIVYSKSKNKYAVKYIGELGVRYMRSNSITRSFDFHDFFGDICLYNDSCSAKIDFETYLESICPNRINDPMPDFEPITK